MRILIVGTMPPPICGTTVSLKLLVDDIKRHDTAVVTVIDTRGIRSAGIIGVARLFVALTRFLLFVPAHDVVALHLNSTAVPFLGSLAVMACFLSRTRLLIRQFGGLHSLRDLKGMRGYVFRWTIRNCDMYLVQTKAQLASALSLDIDHVAWFPTSRPAPRTPIERSACRRFVFVGWVSKSKGVAEILEVGKRLSRNDVRIDVYGPFREGLSRRDFDGQDTVRYCGQIDAGKASDRISEYDALLLPTRWEGEGYPGVIMEAYQAGIPVIATRWMSIPEIVDDSSGILIRPASIDELLAAIDRLVSDDELYRRLCSGARSKAACFSTPVWTDRFIGYCASLVASQRRNSHQEDSFA